MGTLTTTINRLRLRLKDSKSTEFSDEDLISLIDSTMSQIFKELVNIESNLVVTEGTISCTAGVSDYTFSEAFDLVNGSLWVDSPDTPLIKSISPYTILTGDSIVAYALLANGDIRFFPEPVEDTTVNLLYYENYTSPTVDTLSTYDFPWSGIWNLAIERSTFVEALEILERSLGTAAVQASDAWDKAFNATYRRGHIRRQATGAMF